MVPMVTITTITSLQATCRRNPGSLKNTQSVHVERSLVPSLTAQGTPVPHVTYRTFS